MTKNIKNYVIQELEAYPRILRQISVLRYEMEHPAHVSAQEMLDAMTYACGDRTGSSPGHVSDKTFYIAMNYRQKAAAANSEISEEISAKLMELERKKGRIEYYVRMLDSRKANVIRLCFFEGRTIEDAAEELNISAKTAQIAKKKAIEELTDLFGNVKKCAVGKHPKSEKHGNTAQFSEVERSGTQENCGGIGSGCRLRLHPLPVLRRRQSHRVACIDPDAVVVDKNIAKNDRFDLFSR